METITLFNRSKRRKNSRDRHVNIEVASTEAVAGLTHENGMLVVPDVEAVTLHPGDSIDPAIRSEEHTSELQSLMRISYAVFCLKKKNSQINNTIQTQSQHK